jgi:uncharacterized protein YndB with AHSA1/START domain
MTVSTETFVYVTYIATTSERVWKALVEGELTRQYWKHEIVSDWKPGPNWELIADAADATEHSRVAIDIETVGEMVRLTVTHDQLTPEMRRKITNGWPRVLSSLKSFPEMGRPLGI